MTAEQATRGGPTRSASLTFASQVHSVEAIKKAAYKFCAIASVDIVPSAADYVCTLNFLKQITDDEAAAHLNSFKIEVLDQGLRTQIADETASTRNAVLAYAFSKTGLQAGG